MPSRPLAKQLFSTAARQEGTQGVLRGKVTRLSANGTVTVRANGREATALTTTDQPLRRGMTVSLTAESKTGRRVLLGSLGGR